MEDILTQLMNDASSTKHATVRKSCQTALDLLEANAASEIPAYDLREKCLVPFQLALETKAKKLAAFAVSGIQQIMKDERFQSSIESESEEKWLPIQVLNTVFSTPTLPEDTQVEIMKLLLNMTFSTAWCMNAKVIAKVTQVYIDTYTASSHSVRGAVKAASTQLLSSFVEKLHKVEDEVVEDGSDILADFKAKGNSNKVGMINDVVAILKFFTEKLEQASAVSTGQGRQSIPLLLEGVYTIISSCPPFIRDDKTFQEILWKQLCPSLISLLGTPKSERSVPVLQKSLSREDIGRGSGCSLTAPNLQVSTAKTIYNIAVSLVQLMGPVGSLRPMLESVFHRMLLYPPPQHRLDALKAVKELLKNADSLCNLAVPPSDIEFNEKTVLKNPNSDISLLKLMVDSIQESCHCNDSAVCITSVMCIDEMLGSLEQISKGVGINDTTCDSVSKYYRYLNKGVPRSESCSDYDGGVSDLDLNGSLSLSESHDEQDKEEHDKEVKVESEEEKTNEIKEKSPELSAAEPLEDCDISNNNLNANAGFLLHKQEQLKQQTIIREELKKRYNKLGSEYEAVERQNARELITQLSKVLPQIGQMYSVTEVDEALQQFASNFCIALYRDQESVNDQQACHMAILNADGVYVTAIAALLLNLKLSMSGYYNNHDSTALQMSEKEFLDDILGSGLLLFLSPAWLSEIYQQIISNNILQVTNCLGSADSVLIQVLKDIDGLNSHEIGSQLLSYSTINEELEDVTECVHNQLYVDTGKKLAKRILSKCWDGVLDVLSVLLNGKSSCGISSSLALMIGTEGAKEESIRAREAIVMSLDGLQKAAKLCCTLGLQQRCGSVFLQLASTSCVLFDTQKSPILERKAAHKTSSSTKPNKPVRLHAAHVLSMDVVMTTGLEMGSHSADCWKHVFRCSAFISELEHTYFSQGNNQSSLPKLQQEQMAKDQDGCDTELYSVPVTTAVPVAPRINIPNLIKQSSIESGWDRSISGGGVLNSAQASQALCGLSQEVDRLFEDAANKLNLCALLNFLSELSEAGRLQLIKVTKHKEEEDLLGESQQLPSNALHLYRLQEVMMKVVHSDRPYVHLMRCWSVVSSFLVEAAGHHDRNVSRMAVTCVHDFILAMLVDHPELPHFHVNELLCKTFENMLCLELCDGDVQDQIVCSICELVEACTADIRSGWRPLFGALRAVKIEYTTNEEVNEARQRHIAAVLDVFEVYLNTDNILVFANAAVDCILCLLKYVRGPGEFEDLSDDDDSDTGSDFDVSAPSGENLCVPALGYLRLCSKILQRMWKMPACPVFNGAQRIHTDSDQNFVDTSIPHMDMEDFLKKFNEKSPPPDYTKAAGDNAQSEVIAMATKPKSNLAIQRSLDEEDRVYDSGSITSTDSGISSVDKQSNRCQGQSSTVKVKCDTNLEILDNHSGILHVWFLLLDGLASSVSACPRNYQPDTLEMLFELLRSVSKVPGPKFALYCVNHLLLPMLQNWLRTGAKKYGYWETGATKFKQCCGLCTDLIVDFIEEFSDCKGDIVPMVEMMLKQLLDVLIECISQPVEALSRLGCSCIRHILLSAGGSFTEEMWQIGGIAMQKALDTSTFYIQQLMVLFQVNSENFYGDTGQVKVAMRQDSTPMENERLKHLAHQVFLLDSQLCFNGPVLPETEEDKSFVFLLYGQGNENSINPDDIITRIPFRSVVIGLLANQLLIQTVGSVLLSKDNVNTSDGEQTVDKDGDCPSKMPGMLPYLSTRNVLTFLKCLRSSYKLAGEFDARPGLKFLIQKVARTAVAVNLYKQAGASMIFYIHTLIQIGASINGMSRKNIRELLKGIHEKDIDIHNLEIDTVKRLDRVSASPETFLHLLTRVCDELCQTYVDILNDDGIVDQMSEQQVFFLIAQPDDISDILKKKHPSESSVENQSQTIDVIQPGVFLTSEAVSTQAHSVQQDSSDGEDTPDDKKSQISDSDQSCQTMKSKRELREEQESKIYTLATDTLIKSLMTEYKKRKHHHAMPSFVKIGKQKKSAPPSKKTDVDDVIEKQQKSSTMKDSEARKQSWTELLCTILELFQQLPDNKFDSLMPTIFYCVNQLVCHADDRRLKDALGQWLHRVGVMMELSPF